MHLSRYLPLAAALLGIGFSSPAHATDYPLVVTDLAGRNVEIKAEPQRIVVQDGRDLFTLAVLDREDPFKRIVAWNNILARSDPDSFAAFAARWPESSARPIDMKFGDEGQVNLEQVAATKPDLLIFQVRTRQALDDADLFDRLAGLGIPIVLVDTELEPTKNSPKTVDLLGRVLNREAEAKAFNDFYAERLALVRQRIEGAPKKPLVFIEAKAGQKGPESCCFTHGDVYFGKLVAEAGGENLGSRLVKGRTGDVATETLIDAKPDVLLMSGSKFSNDGSISPPFGIAADRGRIEASLKVLSGRKGFQFIKAVEDDRVYGLYHQLYASPWNVYAIEFMAKAFYPDRFADLDPEADLRTLVDRFTGLPKDLPLVFGAKAPLAD